MAQQKRAQQGQDDKSICILWMDERGEGGMDARNIYCLVASTPCAYTWSGVKARRRWHDRVCLSRERKFAFGPRRRRERWENSREKERAKLQSLNMLSIYLPLYAEFDGEFASDRKLVKSGGQRVRRAIRSRIYKEWRRDLCRAVGYLLVSMAHAISLHGYRYILSTSRSTVSFPFPSSPPLFLSHFEYILLYYRMFLSLFSFLSFRRDLIYLKTPAGWIW